MTNQTVKFISAAVLATLLIAGAAVDGEQGHGQQREQQRGRLDGDHPHGSERDEHTERAVVFPSITNRIEMRAENQRLGLRVRALRDADQVECRILTHFEPGESF